MAAPPPASSFKPPAKPRFTFDASDPVAFIASSKTPSASEFDRNRHKKLAAKNWDAFYKSHTQQTSNLNGQFFKDRHWTSREFEALGRLPGIARVELPGSEEEDTKGKGKEKLVDPVVLEVGCGTGAFVYPLLEESPTTRFHAFDFSQRAVEQVKAHAQYNPAKVHAFVHDLTAESPTLAEQLASAAPEFWVLPSDPASPPQPSTSHLPDIISCIFVLSALPPKAQAGAVRSLISVLKPGGTLILRDYALHDQAQLRFHALPSQNYASVPSLLSAPVAPGEEEDEEKGKAWYRRGDSTMCYFFTAGEIEKLVKEGVEEGYRMEGEAV
ncbi:methyltransferase, partial [Pseudohyphozyma bogoriensis]